MGKGYKNILGNLSSRQSDPRQMVKGQIREKGMTLAHPRISARNRRRLVAKAQKKGP